MDGGLKSHRRRMYEDINPMEGAINIVDAMLVFACGLMLSLIIYWNVDLKQTSERIDLRQGQEITQPEVREELMEIEEGQGQLYERMGTVYKDPATGQLFMLTE